MRLLPSFLQDMWLHPWDWLHAEVERGQMATEGGWAFLTVFGRCERQKTTRSGHSECYSCRPDIRDHDLLYISVQMEMLRKD